MELFRKGKKMRIASVAPLAAAALRLSAPPAVRLRRCRAQRISGPHVHENLAIYFIHGTSADGPVPLTLTEALAKGRVQVLETGRVNELQIENTGDEEVFVQAGDIVKGGRQDRVLTVSLVLPPQSGMIPIASFCVEPGRWSARGGEDHTRFTSATEAMPSARRRSPSWRRRRAPSRSDEARRRTRSQRGGDTASRQQRRCGTRSPGCRPSFRAGVNARVASPQSATSLQLSLEHAKLKEAQGGLRRRTRAARPRGDDVVGYVVAINGRTVSANVYPSNGLFQKMWGKQLAAVVTEAIGDKANATLPAAGPAGRGGTGLPGRGREGPRRGARDRRQHAPGDARRRRRALQRGPPRQGRLGAQELPGQVDGKHRQEAGRAGKVGPPRLLCLEGLT